MFGQLQLADVLALLKTRQRLERIASLQHLPPTSLRPHYSTKLKAAATSAYAPLKPDPDMSLSGASNLEVVRSIRLLFAPWHGELVCGPSPWNLVREHAGAWHSSAEVR